MTKIPFPFQYVLSLKNLGSDRAIEELTPYTHKSIMDVLSDPEVRRDTKRVRIAFGDAVNTMMMSPSSKSFEQLSRETSFSVEGVAESHEDDFALAIADVRRNMSDEGQSLERSISSMSEQKVNTDGSHINISDTDIQNIQRSASSNNINLSNVDEIYAIFAFATTINEVWEQGGVFTLPYKMLQSWFTLFKVSIIPDDRIIQLKGREQDGSLIVSLPVKITEYMQVSGNDSPTSRPSAPFVEQEAEFIVKGDNLGTYTVRAKEESHFSVDEKMLQNILLPAARLMLLDENRPQTDGNESAHPDMLLDTALVPLMSDKAFALELAQASMKMPDDRFFNLLWQIALCFENSPKDLQRIYNQLDKTAKAQQAISKIYALALYKLQLIADHKGFKYSVQEIGQAKAVIDQIENFSDDEITKNYSLLITVLDTTRKRVINRDKKEYLDFSVITALGINTKVVEDFSLELFKQNYSQIETCLNYINLCFQSNADADSRHRIFATLAKQNTNKAFAYLIAVTELKSVIQDSRKPAEQRTALQNVLHEIESLTPSQHYLHRTTLTQVLQRSTRLLTQPTDLENINAYGNLAKRVNRHSWGKVLGAGMLVLLGVSVVALSAAAIVASFGLATLPSAMGIAIGTSIAVKALSVFTATLGVGLSITGVKIFPNPRAHLLDGVARAAQAGVLLWKKPVSPPSSTAQTRIHGEKVNETSPLRRSSTFNRASQT